MLRLASILLVTALPALATVAGIRPYTAADYSETNTATVAPRATSTTVTATVNGRITVTTTTTTKHDQQIAVASSGAITPPSSVPSAWLSTNTAVGTVNGSGLVTHVGDGTTTIIHETPYGNFTTTLTLATTTTVQGTVTGWASGTLGANLNSEVDTRLAAAPGGTLATTGQMFSTADDTNDVYVRNTSNVFHDVDLSGTSVWQSEAQAYNSQFGITLVTPVDAIGILHETHPVGTVFEWIDNANVPHYARVIANSQPDGFSLHHLAWQASRSDTTAVATPTTLHIDKVMPANFWNYAPDGSLNYYPVVVISQLRQTSVVDVGGGLNLSTLVTSLPTEAGRAPYIYNALPSGDSGFPFLVLVNGEAVLLATHYSTFSGPYVHYCIADMNAALAAFSGGTYQLTQVNLSGFSGPY